MQKYTKRYKAVIKGVSEEGYIRALIGPATVDRDGDLIEPAAWEKAMPLFMAHPVLLSSHEWYKLTAQIGEVVGYSVSTEGCEMLLKYYHGQLGPDEKAMNPEADWGYFLAKQGIAAFSHAFYIKAKTTYPPGEKGPNGETCRIHELELLETSQVLIGANQDALQRSLEKALDPDRAPAAAADSTDTRVAKTVTLTIDATNADAFGKFLKNETSPPAGASNESGPTEPTVFDAILDGKAAGGSQAANDDEAGLAKLAEAVAGLKKSLTKEK